METEVSPHTSSGALHHVESNHMRTDHFLPKQVDVLVGIYATAPCILHNHRTEHMGQTPVVQVVHRQTERAAWEASNSHIQHVQVEEHVEEHVERHKAHCEAYCQHVDHLASHAKGNS